MEPTDLEQYALQTTPCKQCLGTGFDFDHIVSEDSESRKCVHCNAGTVLKYPRVAQLVQENIALKAEVAYLKSKLDHFLYR